MEDSNCWSPYSHVVVSKNGVLPQSTVPQSLIIDYHSWNELGYIGIFEGTWWVLDGSPSRCPTRHTAGCTHTFYSPVLAAGARCSCCQQARNEGTRAESGPALYRTSRRLQLYHQWISVGCDRWFHPQTAVVAILKQHGLGTVQGFWTCGCGMPGMRTWERAALVHLGTAKLSQSWYYEIKYILDHLGTKYIQVPCFLLTPYFYSNSWPRTSSNTGVQTQRCAEIEGLVGLLRNSCRHQRKVPKFLLKDLWLQFFQHPFPFCFCRTCHDFAVCSFLASPPKNGECPWFSICFPAEKQTFGEVSMVDDLWRCKRLRWQPGLSWSENWSPPQTRWFVIAVSIEMAIWGYIMVYHIPSYPG